MTPVMSGGSCVSILTSCLGRSIYRLRYTHTRYTLVFANSELTTRCEIRLRIHERCLLYQFVILYLLYVYLNIRLRFDECHVRNYYLHLSHIVAECLGEPRPTVTSRVVIWQRFNVQYERTLRNLTAAFRIRTAMRLRGNSHSRGAILQSLWDFRVGRYSWS